MNKSTPLRRPWLLSSLGVLMAGSLCVAASAQSPTVPTAPATPTATTAAPPEAKAASTTVSTSSANDPWPTATPGTTPELVEPPPSSSLPADAASQASARAELRWKAIVEGKFDDAFKYFTPASKTNYSGAELQRHWSQYSPKGARVREAQCSGEVCTIMVFVDGAIRLPRVGLTQQLIPSIERWAWDGASFSLLRK